MITLVDDFIHFLNHSPTAWHAAKEIGNHFAFKDFTPLEEGDEWDLHANQSYFVQRGASIVAFSLPKKKPKRALIVASHLDSPALKLKHNPIFHQEGFNFLRTEVYGGPILSSWINRDLGIAGRIYLQNQHHEIEEHLIYLDDLPLMIADLAIHLRTDKDQKMQKKQQLCPLLSSGKKITLQDLLQQDLQKHQLLSFDLYLVPIEPPSFLGISKEFFGAYRLDNLAGAHASLVGHLCSDSMRDDMIKISVYWNHEEIGSHTEEGASSPFFLDTFTRICHKLGLGEEEFFQLKSRSFSISVDAAHAYHPLFEKHYDKENSPQLGQGVAIKYNASHRYASSGATSGKLTSFANTHKIPLQGYTSHSDMPCGTTIGPIYAANTGIPTVDIGLPMLSMHASRELIALEDHQHLCKLLKGVFDEW